MRSASNRGRRRCSSKRRSGRARAARGARKRLMRSELNPLNRPSARSAGDDNAAALRHSVSMTDDLRDDAREELLANIALFESLTHDDLRSLTQRVEEARYDSGDVI